MLRGLRLRKRLRTLPDMARADARIGLPRPGVPPRGPDRGLHDGAGGRGLLQAITFQPVIGSRWAGHLAVAVVAGGLGWWGGQHQAAAPAVAGAQGTALTASTGTATGLSTASRVRRAARAPLQPGPVFVHRNGSVLREEPKTSGRKLKKEAKGARVVLISQGDGWAKVTDGNITGWMRASVLGEAPPD